MTIIRTNNIENFEDYPLIQSDEFNLFHVYKWIHALSMYNDTRCKKIILLTN